MSASRSPIALASVKGALCMVAGTFLLTCHDAISKWLTGTYHLGELMLYRSAAPLLVLIVILWHSGGLAAVKPRYPRANMTRAVLATLTSMLVVGSYAVLPLGDALAIVFASPIFLAALSVPFLGERVYVDEPLRGDYLRTVGSDAD